MDAITQTSSPTAGSAAPASGVLRQLRLAQAYTAPAPRAAAGERSPDTVTLGSIRPAGPGPMPEKARSLVAARVDVTSMPDAPAAAASPDALPFYRRPADRNLAATAILAGRTLDVRG